jgi:electron transfer flavoprotein beta subunit
MLKIIVPIKQVPETGMSKWIPKPAQWSGMGWSACEPPGSLFHRTALSSKEKHGATVTVLTMGPLNAVKSLEGGDCHGCDDGYILSDRAFAGQTPGQRLTPWLTPTSA